MADFLLIQGSLNPNSRTAIVVKKAADDLSKLGKKVEIIDLREIAMPFCDGRDDEDYDPETRKIFKKIAEAEAIIFGMPVYCYSISGPLKNFIDLHAKAMKNKKAGILCNAGGHKSYLAAADLSKVLAFESNCTTLQPVVYTSKHEFENGVLTGEKALEKLEKLMEALSS